MGKEEETGALIIHHWLNSEKCIIINILEIKRL